MPQTYPKFLGSEKTSALSGEECENTYLTNREQIKPCKTWITHVSAHSYKADPPAEIPDTAL